MPRAARSFARFRSTASRVARRCLTLEKYAGAQSRQTGKSTGLPRPQSLHCV
jgi:hypothetical protein